MSAMGQPRTSYFATLKSEKRHVQTSVSYAGSYPDCPQPFAKAAGL